MWRLPLELRFISFALGGNMSEPNQINPRFMRAMVLEEVGKPLQLRHIGIPDPGPGEILIRVRACGVCRTDLHIIDGELNQPKLPLILGHEIAGEVAACGPGVDRFRVGERVGVPWLGRTCGTCEYCLSGQENLCNTPLFTGYTRDGGFADYTVADQRFCFHLPGEYSPAEAAPLLCAGLIGYRTYRLAGTGVKRLGIYGFGAAAHIIAQVAKFQGKEVYAFTRPGDEEAQHFALSLGAAWAGDSDTFPPNLLDAALIFAPVGGLVPAALRAVRKGGVVVCGGIYMSDIPSFPYQLLWEERQVRSVANLTRQDGEELLAIAPQVPVRSRVTLFKLEEANEALQRLRTGNLQGAAVLAIA
jgi:propanol-preferring alcohol dehydrogenase